MKEVLIFCGRRKILNPTSFTTSKNRQKQYTACECVHVCVRFPNMCIHLASNLIVPPCGFGEIHCGLCVCAHVCACTCESVCCGCRGYYMWLKKTVSVPLRPSVVVTLCECVFTRFFLLVCAFACVCVCE